MSDFSRATLRSLACKGITLVGLTLLPGTGSLPYATGERGYLMADNGTGRVWTFRQVLEAAA